MSPAWQRLFERDGALCIVDGRRLVSITGSPASRDVVRAVLDGLDGRRDIATVAAAAGLDEQTTREVVAGLRDIALVYEDERPAATALDGLAASAVLAASLRPVPGALNQAILRAGQRRVRVTGPRADRLCDLVREAGLSADPVRVAELDRMDPERDVLVALPDADGATAGHCELNARALERGLTWLPIGGFDGLTKTVGPIVVPGQTACWECVLARRASMTTYPAASRHVQSMVPGAPEPAALTAWADSLTVVMLIRWLLRGDPEVPGRLVMLRPGELVSRPAWVHRVPRCPGCRSDDTVPAAAPWELLDAAEFADSVEA